MPIILRSDREPGGDGPGAHTLGAYTGFAWKMHNKMKGGIMELRDRRVEISQIVAAAVSFVVLALAGCSSEERLRPAYLSGESRLVGGGLKIEWKAPEAGTVYLVEKRTDKLVQTYTLATGESYKFMVESVVDAEELEELIGISMAKAQFLLYFKPAGQESGAS